MKKLFSILLVFSVIALSLSACGHRDDAPATEGAAAEEIVTPEPAIEESYEEPEIEEYEEEPIEPEEPIEEDPMAFFRIDSPGPAYENKPIIMRGDKYYLIENMFEDGDSFKDSSFGRISAGTFYLDETLRLEDDTNIMVTWGTTPKTTIEAGDSIILYSSDSVPEIRLHKRDFYGYCLSIEYLSTAGELIINYGVDNQYFTNAVSEFSVTDSSGNIMEDPYNLTDGESYTISWFEGTEYHEETLIADSECYAEATDHNIPDYVLEGELTKDGYAKYDWQGVPPGFYTIEVSNTMRIEPLIEIK